MDHLRRSNLGYKILYYDLLVAYLSVLSYNWDPVIMRWLRYKLCVKAHSFNLLVSPHFQTLSIHHCGLYAYEGSATNGIDNTHSGIGKIWKYRERLKLLCFAFGTAAYLCVHHYIYAPSIWIFCCQQFYSSIDLSRQPLCTIIILKTTLIIT